MTSYRLNFLVRRALIDKLALVRALLGTEGDEPPLATLVELGVDRLLDDVYQAFARPP